MSNVAKKKVNRPHKNYVDYCAGANRRFMEDRNPIVFYVRDADHNALFHGHRGKPVACFVAMRDGTRYKFGWSAVNQNEDEFVKQVGLYIAAKRALGDKHDPVPQKYNNHFLNFLGVIASGDFDHVIREKETV